MYSRRARPERAPQALQHHDLEWIFLISMTQWNETHRVFALRFFAADQRYIIMKVALLKRMSKMSVTSFNIHEVFNH